jgi:hypothetical protein
MAAYNNLIPGANAKKYVMPKGVAKVFHAHSTSKKKVIKWVDGGGCSMGLGVN